MAGSVNKVILIGNLGKDPEVRSFQNGGKVVNLTIATSETWTDRTSGERKEKTQWHNVVIKNEKLGENAEKYLKKGSKVYIEGALETRKWVDQASGQDKYATEVVVAPFRGELTFLSGRNDDAGGNGGYEARSSSPSPRQQPARGPANAGGPSWDSNKGGGDLDDEIPF